MFVIILILWANVVGAADKSSCEGKAEFPMDQLSAENVMGYLRTNPKIDDPGKFVCCLPKSLRGSFVVVHNSDAGQSGNPHGPRVLLFPPRVGTAEPPSCVLSINGGGADLNNPNNVEMMCADKVTRQLNFFDFSFEGGPVKFHKNSQECVNCHGAGGAIPVAGLHPNFEPFGDWSRILGGFKPCPGAEAKYVKAVTAVSKRSMRTNPRYRCLDQTSETAQQNFKILSEESSFASGVIELDFRLDILNNERIARVLRATPDYERYKYAIVGSMACMNLPMFSPGKSWTNWIPPDVLRNHNDKSSQLEIIANAEDLEGAYQAGRQTQDNELQRRRKLLAGDARKLKTGLNPELHLGPRGRCDEKTKEPDPIEHFFRPVATGYTPYDRFVYDGLTRSLTPMSARLRFLVEGRGISLADLDMDPLGGTYRRPTNDFSIAEQLVAAEPALSPLKEALGHVLTSKTSVFNLGSVINDSAVRQAFCARIQKASLKAFSMPKAPSLTSPEGKAATSY